MKRQYEWKAGVRYNVDPQPVGEALAELKCPTAQQIVEAARDEDSPLHELFEWDVGVAAHEYWLATAQLIARNITVTMTLENHDPIVVRAFETIDMGEQEGKCYVPVERVFNKDEYCQQVMARIRGSLISVERELNNYSYLSERMAKASEKVKEAEEKLA
jgi:hypothetical protein